MTDHNALSRIAGSIGAVAAGMALVPTAAGQWLQAAILWFVCAVAYAVAFYSAAAWMKVELALLRGILKRHATGPRRTTEVVR